MMTQKGFAAQQTQASLTTYLCPTKPVQPLSPSTKRQDPLNSLKHADIPVLQNCSVLGPAAYLWRRFPIPASPLQPGDALPRQALMLQVSSESSCPSQNHTQASVALKLGAGKATTQPNQNSLFPSTEYGILHGHGMGEALAKDTWIHCPSQSVSYHIHGTSLQLHIGVENQ